MAEAPICHVSVDQQIDQPPAQQLPAIPQVSNPNDLSGIINAINAITQTINMMLGRLQSSGGPGSQGAAKNQANQKGRWQEVNRAVKKMRVYNKDDHDQYVDVLQIQSFTMRDSVTGTQWTWNRGSSAGAAAGDGE